MQKKKHDQNVLYSPVFGKCIDISHVPDKIFADKIMGEGVAFEFDGEYVYAPCDGIIQLVANTKHAIGILSDAGLEILIHVGMDTVNLEGKGFETLIRKDQRVQIGTPLLKIDRQLMKDNNINLMTPMVITNHKSFDLKIVGTNQTVEPNQNIIVEYLNKNEINLEENTTMKYKKLCEDIIENIGGKSNVISVSHCVTRLRFKLKDVSKADTKVLKAMDGVMEIIQTGGQYQVVIGTHVDEVYNELIEVGGFSSQSVVEVNEDDNDEQKGLLSKFLVLMSGIFQPTLSILMASGMIKALLKLIALAGWMEATDSTYIVINAIGDAIFYFFPIVLGWSAAKKFGIK